MYVDWYLCFNPCFVGLWGFELCKLALRRFASRFQSLFCWIMGLWGHGGLLPAILDSSFNPCFVGLWGFEDHEMQVLRDVSRVSILVLLDYGVCILCQLCSVHHNSMFQSLFCWIMGLWELGCGKVMDYCGSFNPCFVGLWGFEPTLKARLFCFGSVSILVLLDYGALS